MVVDLSEAHSVVEASLYLLVTPCPTCGHGSADAEWGRTADGAQRIVATCRNCGASEAHAWTLPGDLPSVDPLSSHALINASEMPSRLIDVGQWLTLASMMEARADNMPDAAERRWYRIRARQCFDEALKFYPAAATHPPATALFTESSRQAFRTDAGQFARDRLLGRREVLPTTDASGIADSPADGRPRRPWWQFWSS